MIKIEFGKIYRRLDGNPKFANSSLFNLASTVEVVDNSPQFDSNNNYVIKNVIIYCSNKSSLPTSISQMTQSDIIPSGTSKSSGDSENIVNCISLITGVTSWICFVKQNAADDIEAYTLSTVLRNEDFFNSLD